MAILHILYGIYHLSRSPIGKPPATQANYNVFASTFDLGLVPFYVFGAYISYIEYANVAYNWGTLLGNTNGIPHLIANINFILSVASGALHAVSFGISMFLAIVFRRITRLPPDMNPLEDNLTARPHKRTKSEIAEKHLSQSTVDSGIGMDDPLIGSPRIMPFSMHNRHPSSGDGLNGFIYENQMPLGPFVHPEQLPYADPTPKPLQFQPRPQQQGNVIPRKPVQSSQVPTQDVDNLSNRPTPFMHLNVPNQGPYQASISDRSRTVSPMSDNWIAYPSRSPSPLDNLQNPQTENAKSENVARRDISSMYSRSNTTASTDSGPNWVSSAQRYGWNIDEAIREDARGEYESLAMHEHYGNDDEYLGDCPQQYGLYDDTERDVGDEPINIYLDDRLSDDDDLKDENEEPATQLLNPLALNPPTPLASRSNLHEETTSKPLDDRHALTDVPNLSPPPNLRSDSPPGDSPEKKTGRYYGELESNPSISIRGDRDVSEQSAPLRKKSKLQKKNSKSRKMKTYNTLRQDEHASDEDIDNEASPAIPKDTNENDRRGRVVSNSGADICNNAGPASASLASYGNYIAGLGIGVGRRRDVSGKMAEEGRSGTMVNAGRPGTEPEHKKPIRAAGWARFAGL